MSGFNVKDTRRLFEAIDRLIEVVSDVRELDDGWQPHVDIYSDYERRHLDTQGAGGWIPNTDEYQARKVKAVGNKPQMQYSGDTYRSLTEDGAPGFVRIEGADSLKAGSDNPLARIHHEGRGRNPERLMMVITNEQVHDHHQQFVESYSATTRAQGFRVI